jgi:hypothetical protein
MTRQRADLEWDVVEVKVYRVAGPNLGTEQAAVAARRAQPDLDPISESASAELVSADPSDQTVGSPEPADALGILQLPQGRSAQRRSAGSVQRPARTEGT